VAAFAAVYVVAAALIVIAGLREDARTADVAVVFGNEVLPDGTPSRRLAARLDRALDLYRNGTVPRIIVSSGRSRAGHDEAAVMRDYLVRAGVPAEAVIPDPKGATSYRTALNSMAIATSLSLRSAVVVSQYFHTPRCALAMKKAGWRDVSSAYARYFELRDLYSLFREVAAIVYYSARTWPSPPVSDDCPRSR
jgi:vancomycin permeability regulator SanA